MDAVAAVRRPRRHLVQEDHVALPFLDAHGVAGQARQLAGQHGQLVIVGGEQRAAAVDVVQMLHAGPGDGQAVEGRRAAPDLVQDDQRAVAGLVQDGRRLHHLHHEGRAAARQIVGRTHAAVEPVHHPDVRALRRHETAHLGQHGDQRVLAQEGRFTGHVRAGQQPQPVVRSEVAVVGDEGPGVAGVQHRLHHRVTPALDREGEAAVHHRPAVAPLRRQLGQRGGDVERGQGVGGLGDGLGAAGHLLHEVVEQLQLHGQRLVGGLGNAALQVRQLHRAEAHGVRHGLAVHEDLAPLLGHQLVRVGRRHLDVIAEHVVVFDLQRRHPGDAGVFDLKPGDQPPALVAQGHQLVQRVGIVARDEAAVAGEQRQLRRQRLGQLLDQLAVLAQPLGHGAQPVGQRSAGMAVQQQADGGRLGQTVAHGREVARAAAPQRQAGQRALQVRAAAQRLAQVAAQPLLVQRELDHVQPLGDGRGVGQRRRELGGEQARPRPGHRAVDGGEQAAAPVAGQGAGQLQVAAGRRVDLHDGAGAEPARRRQARHAALLRQLHIGDQRTGRRHLGAGELAVGVQRADAVEGEQPLPPVLAVEARSRLHGQAGLPFAPQLVEVGALAQLLGDQHLLRVEAAERGAQPGALHRLHDQLAGGQLQPGQPEAARRLRHRGQPVGGAGIEQAVLGQRAGGDDADDAALHHRLAAALLGLRRVFHLLADGHAEALADQALQVGFVAVDRDAAHRDVLAQMLAALGQRDVQRPGGVHRVLEEHLVEIAHPVEQQAVGMGLLDLQILRHHRSGVGRNDGGRDGGGRVGHGSSTGCVVSGKVGPAP